MVGSTKFILVEILDNYGWMIYAVFGGISYPIEVYSIILKWIFCITWLCKVLFDGTL